MILQRVKVRGIWYRTMVMALPILIGAACSTPTTPTPITMSNPPIKYEGPFIMTIDTTKSYTATLKTSKGDITVTLNAEKAPSTVNNFVNLAREKFYDNSTFHRVLPGFMVQGGDPTGTGGGGPGYTIPDEFNDLTHKAGVISMANTGAPNSGGSQFFITYAPQPHLNGRHTVFGEVIEGMDTLKKLTPRDPSQSPTKPGDSLLTIVIEEQNK
jgi:cyclophilin family peptidyl-prolyl cis-trans isomerase